MRVILIIFFTMLLSIDIIAKDRGFDITMNEADDYKTLKAYDFKSIYLGNAIHYYYECKDLEAVRNIYGDFVDMKIVQNAKKIEDILGKLGIKDCEILHEVPYISNGNLKRADLVVKAKSSIYIIDFKSSKPDDLSGYKEQVNGYKIDFKELENREDIRGFLYFVKEDEILEV